MNMYIPQHFSAATHINIHISGKQNNLFGGVRACTRWPAVAVVGEFSLSLIVVPSDQKCTKASKGPEDFII